ALAAEAQDRHLAAGLAERAAGQRTFINILRAGHWRDHGLLTTTTGVADAKRSAANACPGGGTAPGARLPSGLALPRPPRRRQLAGQPRAPARLPGPGCAPACPEPGPPGGRGLALSADELTEAAAAGRVRCRARLGVPRCRCPFLPTQCRA